MRSVFLLICGSASIIAIGILAAPVAFAQSATASCLPASAQDALGSSLQQLTNLADSLLVQNLPASILSADGNLVSAISEVVLQVEEACLPAESDGGGGAPASESVTAPSEQITVPTLTQSASTGVTFPTTILVTATSLNVRSAPSISASLAGSQTLVAGNEFTATSEVVGDSVDGNDIWYVSSAGNYVWSGGTTVEASALASASSPVAAGSSPSSPLKTPTNKTSPSANNATKVLTDTSGAEYNVAYSYLPDGEVRASFTYKGSSLVVAFGNNGNNVQVASVQSGGSLKPYAWLSDLNLTQFIGTTLVDNLPATQTIFSGYTFATPLYITTDVNPYYVDTPVNAYYITASPVSTVTPGLYYLTIDTNGNITAVQEVYISSTTGAVTEGAVMMVKSTSNVTSVIPTSTVLGNLAPTDYLSDLMNGLQSEGYQISQNTDALGETAGVVSKNSAPVLYFSLGDQVVSWSMANVGSSCIVDSSNNGTPVPVLVADNGNDGLTIPHLDKNFNIAVDPSAYVLWSTPQTSISPDEVQSDLISIFNQGYSPYTQVSGLPQPTEDPDAGAVVILSFGNIPDTDNWSYNQDGQWINQPDSILAQSLTLTPAGSGSGDYVPPGSSDAIINALSAGKEVEIITLNSQYFGPSSFASPDFLAGTLEHEMGHSLGLGDDYTNGNSPMVGGGRTDPIAISQGIGSVLSSIQAKGTLGAVSCAPPGSSNVGTMPSQAIQGFVPIILPNGSSTVWGYGGSCTDAQLADGWITEPACTGDTPPSWCNGYSEGCYLPTPTSTTEISYGGNFPDQPDATTCIDNYGDEYTCASTNCGGAGQLACPVNVPQGTCLDSAGDQVSCPGGFLPLPIIAPPSVPEADGGYECSSDGSCAYNPEGGPYSDETCDNACGDSSQ